MPVGWQLLQPWASVMSLTHPISFCYQNTFFRRKDIWHRLRRPIVALAMSSSLLPKRFGMSKDKLSAAKKILSYLKDGGDTRAFADAARRLIFLKGRDSHDYKFSSAVLEDYAAMSSPWRDRYLAASAFYLKGSGDKDNDLVKRIRAAVAG